MWVRDCECMVVRAYVWVFDDVFVCECILKGFSNLYLHGDMQYESILRIHQMVIIISTGIVIYFVCI